MSSPNFSSIRVELDKQGYRDGACIILERDTSKHMAFPETEVLNGARENLENSLKKDFWWGFLLNFLLNF